MMRSVYNIPWRSKDGDLYAIRFNNAEDELYQKNKAVISSTKNDLSNIGTTHRMRLLPWKMIKIKEIIHEHAKTYMMSSLVIYPTS